MDEDDISERLWATAGRFYERPPNRTILESIAPPFDISKPNIHDSMSEFLAEVAVVDQAIEHLGGLKKILHAAFDKGDPDHGAARSCIKAVDSAARQKLSRGSVDYPVQLVVDNAARVGLPYSALFLVLDMQEAFSQRKQELEAQREAFWEVSGRPPNHHARTIALRFAKKIARHTGKKPTFGTARDGGHPSTEFGRALEEIFKILEIDATVKHPANWAIAQLTDDDLKPETRNALAGLLHPSFTSPGGTGNALAALYDSLAKGDEQ